MSKSKSRTLRRSEQLRDQIEVRIVTGVYPPGARLDEQELAASFGVSRTPVREALIQLAAGGLIDLRPRRGAIIPDMGAERLYEMFEVMAELDAMCGRLAARRIRPDELERLQAAHLASAAAHEAGDADSYDQLNELLHRHIYLASHNGFLGEQALALHQRLRPYRRLQLRVRNRMTASFAEHQEIVDALAAGDGDRAAAALRTHVVIQGERFTDLVAALRQFKAADRLAGAAVLPDGEAPPA